MRQQPLARFEDQLLRIRRRLAGAMGGRAATAHTARELAAIDDALTRLHDAPPHVEGCVRCGGPIPMERLRLVPGTRHCHLHATEGGDT